jgi:hypothetical protein
MSLEIVKHLLNIRFVLEKIYPTKTGIVIDETHIILVPPQKKHEQAPKHQNELIQEAQ